MKIQEISKLVEKIENNIAKVIIGSNETIILLIAALLCKGHVLIEDVPGTGKTMLSKSLAKSLFCMFSRIQFTPDLLPTDILGMNIYNQNSGEFEFKSGPVFTNILLADEINRATPRTQAALLECMQERQVTIDNTTYELEEPFMVLATQNPIETAGTFPLPEAQLDRFIIKTKMGYPTKDESIKIIDRFIIDNPLSVLESVIDKSEIIKAQNAIGKVEVSDVIKQYMIEIVNKTKTIDGVLLGVSTRGLLALLKMSQAIAAIDSRDFVIPDDVKKTAVPVLAHRIICSSVYNSSVNPSIKAVEELLSSIKAPTEIIEGAVD